MPYGPDRSRPGGRCPHRRGGGGPLTAPRSLLNLEAVSKSYGVDPVLSSVSLGISENERIGVVGRNGGGKSTLLNLITGNEEPDEGRVTRTRDIRIGVLPQTSADALVAAEAARDAADALVAAEAARDAADALVAAEAAGGPEVPATGTVRDLVLSADVFAAEHEWAGDARIRAVLAGLGLPQVGLDADLNKLSGGERRRAALAARLIHETDLLVLDEPTNHLDVEGVAWLAEHLTGRPGALLVVTHDRWFLDAVCSTTWEVAEGAVHAYDGGYASYVLARAERNRQAEAAEARRANLVRKELAWLRRGPPARTSKPQFRIDAAQALIEAEPPARDSVELQAFAARRLGKQVYELEDVSFRDILSDVDWQLGPGDRIGVVGVNGSGKSTLLRLLTGELTPDRGRVRVGQTVRAAYLSQEVSELPAHLRVLEAVQEIGNSARLGKVELSASSLAERFGFARAAQWTPVSDLSGGERRRLQLLRLLMAEPNVLLLDEPTNDLDIDTLTALEDLLDSWAGALLVVSHDRYLVERVCDSVIALLGDGKLSNLPGGVDEYLERRQAAIADQAGGRARERRGDSRAARKELNRVERQLSTVERKEARVHEQMAEHATDYGRIAELDEQLRELRTEREELEARWLELAEDAE